MKYTCVDPVEFLYPDIKEYTSSTDKIEILTPRNSYACAQILLWDGEGCLAVECNGSWNPEIYEMVAIPVEANPMITEKNRRPHTPEREAPFQVYDCLKPFEGNLVFKDGVAAVYFSMWIPKDASVGKISGEVVLGECTIPVTVEISSAVVPEETLAMSVWYNKFYTLKYHKMEDHTPEFERLNAEYLRMLRRMRMNVLTIPELVFTDKYPEVIDKGNNQYEFNFREIELYMESAIAEGYHQFYYRLGMRESWEKGTILVNHIPSMTFEGYYYLAQFLPAFQSFLKEHGWEKMIMMSICDEPNPIMTGEYRGLCALVRKYMPDVKLVDAIGYDEGVYNVIDICVPISYEYEKHQKEYKEVQKFGTEVWYYVGFDPRGNGYINRFMDSPLLHTRYQNWANYALGLTGYLHWGANKWQTGHDPFAMSCPVLMNPVPTLQTVLPPGDNHIMYPGKDAPWMSVRLENQRAGAEEYEMLKAVAEKDQERADKLCATVFRSLTDVETDPLVFRTTRNALIRAMEEV